MYDWFKEIGAGCELSVRVLRELLDSGFVVIPGPLAHEQLAQLRRAYDLAVAGAVPPISSFSLTRVSPLDYCAKPSWDRS